MKKAKIKSEENFKLKMIQLLEKKETSLIAISFMTEVDGKQIPSYFVSDNMPNQDDFMTEFGALIHDYIYHPHGEKECDAADTRS